ncbi:MAG: response regulator transcription factor [Treponema sp.]|nr:response regulator transcription factor [Treponema sp.]
MLIESEWEEIKKNLISLYENKQNFSSAELEKKLQSLLVKKNITPLLDERVKEAALLFSLSDREFDVVKEMIAGRGNLEIAENLSVSISTIKKHVYNIFNKAGVNSRTQLLNLIYNLEPGENQKSN